MKGFTIAVAIFILMVALIILNATCLNRTTGEIKKALLALTPEDKEALDSLEALWERKRCSIEFCVTFDEIRTMDELLIELRAASESASVENFTLARHLALAAVERLRRLERITADTLL